MKNNHKENKFSRRESREKIDIPIIIMKDLNDIKNIIESIIHETPTGELRNKLTDINIEIKSLLI